MPWVPRGLRDGIVTTRYPRRPDGYGGDFLGSVRVLHGVPASAPAVAEAAAACPTTAIFLTASGARIDRGRCVLCGRCVALAPDAFAFDSGVETASFAREALVVPPVDEDDAVVARARAALGTRVRALRRSVHVRHVDAGSDGSEEWEVAALTNPVYDVQRLGVFFTASPKHADILLVTGAGAAGMAEPLRRTYDVMPEPKVVIAAGVDAASGGVFEHGYATRGGVGGIVPVDVFVPGSPASPFGILYGLLLAVGVLGGPVGDPGPDSGGGGAVRPAVDGRDRR
jgi:Ni,Fe-hydrogenase III small subunit/ferredoxin